MVITIYKKNQKLVLLVIFFLLSISFYFSFTNTKNNIQNKIIADINATNTKFKNELEILIYNQNNKQIKNIIKLYFDNNNMYKEIKLKYDFFTFNVENLIKSNSLLNNNAWNLSELSINENYGKLNLYTKEKNIIIPSLDYTSYINLKNNIYIFKNNNNFKNNDSLEVSYTASLNNKIIQTKSKVKLSNIIANEKTDVILNTVPLWFSKNIIFTIKKSKQSFSKPIYKTSTLYLTVNLQKHYEILYNKFKLYALFLLIYLSMCFFILKKKNIK